MSVSMNFQTPSLPFWKANIAKCKQFSDPFSTHVLQELHLSFYSSVCWIQQPNNLRCSSLHFPYFRLRARGLAANLTKFCDGLLMKIGSFNHLDNTTFVKPSMWPKAIVKPSESRSTFRDCNLALKTNTPTTHSHRSMVQTKFFAEERCLHVHRSLTTEALLTNLFLEPSRFFYFLLELLGSFLFLGHSRGNRVNWLIFPQPRFNCVIHVDVNVFILWRKSTTNPTLHLNLNLNQWFLDLHCLCQSDVWLLQLSSSSRLFFSLVVLASLTFSCQMEFLLALALPLVFCPLKFANCDAKSWLQQRACFSQTNPQSDSKSQVQFGCLKLWGHLNQWHSAKNPVCRHWKVASLSKSCAFRLPKQIQHDQ